jgi:hypothetical protein
VGGRDACAPKIERNTRGDDNAITNGGVIANGGAGASGGFESRRGSDVIPKEHR